jgi:hypothetical protein
MAVRGAGADTQVLLGSRNGTNVAFLTTMDGNNFNAAVIAITGAPPGFAAQGIAFGSGNTLWAKAYQGHLYQIAFDPVTQAGGVIQDYAAPSQTPSSLVGIGVDAARNILAGSVLGDVPNDVQLYQLTGTADAPVLFAQSFYASANANGNQNAAIAVKYPRLFALAVNNGVVGYYHTPRRSDRIYQRPHGNPLGGGYRLAAALLPVAV